MVHIILATIYLLVLISCGSPEDENGSSSAIKTQNYNSAKNIINSTLEFHIESYRWVRDDKYGNYVRKIEKKLCLGVLLQKSKSGISRDYAVVPRACASNYSRTNWCSSTVKVHDRNTNTDKTACQNNSSDVLITSHYVLLPLNASIGVTHKVALGSQQLIEENAKRVFPLVTTQAPIKWKLSSGSRLYDLREAEYNNPDYSVKVGDDIYRMYRWIHQPVFTKEDSLLIGFVNPSNGLYYSIEDFANNQKVKDVIKVVQEPEFDGNLFVREGTVSAGIKSEPISSDNTNSGYTIYFGIMEPKENIDDESITVFVKDLPKEVGSVNNISNFRGQGFKVSASYLELGFKISIHWRTKISYIGHHAFFEVIEEDGIKKLKAIAK